MRAIITSVEYADLLHVTLPYNRHHFESVTVVTIPSDSATLKVCLDEHVDVFTTDAFYRNGADFNKFLALEEGLDHIERDGWLCVMDADVLWPQREVCSDPPATLPWLTIGNLYTPYRRMMYDLPVPFEVPPEETWRHYPIHPNVSEWAGYSQIFHASDPALGPPPWHEVNWRHAGGADSMFQRKWPAHKKVRPPFEVLHLGLPGRNWVGRATPYLDGSIPADAQDRLNKVRAYVHGRKQGPGRFDGEKLPCR